MAPTMTNPSPALSKNHRLVYEILKDHGTGTHLTMAQLHEMARERRPGIGFTTVYRALTRLRDQQLICEIAIPGAESLVYELPGGPHAHFRCSQCGRVQDVAYVFPASVAAEIAKAGGIQLETVELSLHGRCRDCSTA
jgi:Fe2+ or Zn2+ uptake regulation protein